MQKNKKKLIALLPSFQISQVDEFGNDKKIKMMGSVEVLSCISGDKEWKANEREKARII